MATTTTTTTTTTVTTVTSEAPSKARLVVILDRSGSMSSIKNEAIGGVNAFVDGQKKVPGEAQLTLVIFDNIIETVHNQVPLQLVPTLTEEVYIPRGMTALYDAIGVTMTQLLSEKQDPTVKTIVAILTDGAENASREFSGKAVADLIKTAETEHNWEVLFLGANIDVEKVATQLNIQGHKFASFAATAKGMADSYEAVNTVTSMYRSAFATGAVLNASDVNLQAQVDQAAKQ